MPLSQLLEEVRRGPRPDHVALIMDGNGRWAASRGLPRVEGHRQGALICERLVRFVAQKRLFPYLTLFAFSTENWERPRQEVEFLFRLVEGFVRDKLAELAAGGVRLRVVGGAARLPQRLRRSLDRAVRETASNDALNLTVALNFGGRWAILQGVRAAVAAAKNGALAAELTADDFRRFLPTRELPDLDLIVRTGGHQRLSNFFLWEAAYAELYFTETLWPDFDEDALVQALRDFQGRSRNFGRVVT
ncbi:MAG: polyprenyl diphosphate synthase [Candidatus Bipolaricaulaceae bacterium]